MMPQRSDKSTPIIQYLGKRIAARKVKGLNGKEFEVDAEGQRIIPKDDEESPGSLQNASIKPKLKHAKTKNDIQPSTSKA